MSTDTLGAIFNSPARVKIMRLFLLNPGVVFLSAMVTTRSNVPATVSRREINILARAGLIVRRVRKEAGKKPTPGWALNPSFEHIQALDNLLFGTEFVNQNELAKRFRTAGRIKLLLLSGVFNGTPEARLDLLLVGDNLKRPVIERIIKSLEAEIGKELAYAAFETPDFIYRASMYDKLIREIIDLPHEEVINSANLLQQLPQV